LWGLLLIFANLNSFTLLLLGLLSLCLQGCSETTDSVVSDVTLYVSGELLERGGVVAVYPLPVSDARWKAVAAQQANTVPPPLDLTPIAATGRHFTAILTQPYHQVQFFYPEGSKHYAFRFRPLPGSHESEALLTTRAISIGGVHTGTGLGEEMTTGFVGLATSGSQVIHVNLARTTENAARVLGGMADEMNAKPITCTVAAVISVCSFATADWPRIRANWSKGIQKLEKEQRGFVALNKCYREAESAGKSGGRCVLISDEAAEEQYEYRDARP
jgi:hypothetical protein